MLNYLIATYYINSYNSYLHSQIQNCDYLKFSIYFYFSIYHRRFIIKYGIRFYKIQSLFESGADNKLKVKLTNRVINYNKLLTQTE